MSFFVKVASQSWSHNWPMGRRLLVRSSSTRASLADGNTPTISRSSFLLEIMEFPFGYFALRGGAGSERKDGLGIK